MLVATSEDDGDALLPELEVQDLPPEYTRHKITIEGESDKQQASATPTPYSASLATTLPDTPPASPPPLSLPDNPPPPPPLPLSLRARQAR